MALPLKYDISIYRGDDWFAPVQIKAADGTPVNLAGFTIAAQIRSTEDATAVAASIDVINRIDAEGKFTLRLTSAVTKLFNNFTTSVYDVELTSSSGIVTTYLNGTFTVTKDVTRGGA